MGFVELYALAAVTVFVTVSVLWAVSVAIRDASIIDIFWGLLFVAIAWSLLVATGGGAGVKVELLVLMVTAWGLRLAFHLGSRNIGFGEDTRYALWRQHGGPHWWLKTYYRIYLFQGLIALVVATPIVAAFCRPHDFFLINALGVLVWAAGFAIEVTADVQLTRFRARPDSRGQVMDEGLWRYSRHPNYFGDAVQWWGLALFVFSGSTWWALLGPLVMTMVFVYISKDVIERGLQKRRPGYARYVAETSAFWPRRPRSVAAEEPRRSRTMATPTAPAAPADGNDDGSSPT